MALRLLHVSPDRRSRGSSTRAVPERPAATRASGAGRLHSWSARAMTICSCSTTELNSRGMAMSTSTTSLSSSRASSAALRPVRRACVGETRRPRISSASAAEWGLPRSTDNSWSSRTSSSRWRSCWRISSTGHCASRTITQPGGRSSCEGRLAVCKLRSRAGGDVATSSRPLSSAHTCLPRSVPSTPQRSATIPTIARPRPVASSSFQATASSSARACPCSYDVSIQRTVVLDGQRYTGSSPLERHVHELCPGVQCGVGREFAHYECCVIDKTSFVSRAESVDDEAARSRNAGWVCSQAHLQPGWSTSHEHAG